MAILILLIGVAVLGFILAIRYRYLYRKVRRDLLKAHMELLSKDLMKGVEAYADLMHQSTPLEILLKDVKKKGDEKISSDV